MGLILTENRQIGDCTRPDYNASVLTAAEKSALAKTCLHYIICLFSDQR